MRTESRHALSTQQRDDLFHVRKEETPLGDVVLELALPVGEELQEGAPVAEGAEFPVGEETVLVVRDGVHHLFAAPLRKRRGIVFRVDGLGVAAVHELVVCALLPHRVLLLVTLHQQAVLPVQFDDLIQGLPLRNEGPSGDGNHGNVREIGHFHDLVPVHV